MLGIGAQILILPALDSVFGFALFFAVGTAIAAWFATSSPRLSYFGVQMALAFYFVNLQDFKFQTDLTIARDKAVGVLLGILAMGFIFNRFGTGSDTEQLLKLLVRNVRMLAQLGLSPVVSDRASAVSQINRLRSQINDNFATLESQTDAAPGLSLSFAIGARTTLQSVSAFRGLSAALRSIFLLELSLLSHRGRREIASELTQPQNEALDHFLKEYSDELMHIAAWIANRKRTRLRASPMIPFGNWRTASRTTPPRTRRPSWISVGGWSPLPSSCGTSANSYSYPHPQQMLGGPIQAVLWLEWANGSRCAASRLPRLSTEYGKARG